MNKQTIYKFMYSKEQNKCWVAEAQGHLYDVLTVSGTVTVGLIYKTPYWRATHYESGLDCTPCSDVGGYEQKWRSKDKLLEALSTVDFNKYLHRPVAQYAIEQVQAYKTRLSK